MADWIIGVDFGGTRMRAALFDVSSETPVQVEVLPTPRNQSGEAILEQLCRVVKSVFPTDSGNARLIVIGCPGPLDVERGTILRAPLFPGMRNVPIRHHVQEALGMTVHVSNDANLAALGEYAFGGGRGSSDMIYLGVGTGIGGGIVLRGQVFSGHAGFAGEIGHICLYPEGLLCGCGRRGCLEAYASGTAIESEARRAVYQGADTQLAELLEEKGFIEAEDVVRFADEGDPLAATIIRNAGRDLGIALASLVNVLNPDRIVVGGGVQQGPGILLQELRRQVRARAMLPMCEQVVVRASELGDRAGLLGAFYLGTQELGLQHS